MRVFLDALVLVLAVVVEFLHKEECRSEVICEAEFESKGLNWS